MPKSPVPIKKKTRRSTKRRKRVSALEMAERRQTVLTMRLKGMTFKDIGRTLNIGYMTVKRDLDLIRQENVRSVTEFNRDKAVADAMSTYDQVELESWQAYYADKSPAKAKYLNLIRMNNKDRIQLLVDIGLVSKAALRIEHTVETEGVLAHWTEDAKALVAMSIIRTQMEGGKPPPQLPEPRQVIEVEVAEEPVVVEEEEEPEAAA